MNYFFDPIFNHYFDFAGRATRKQYWMYQLISFLIYLTLVILTKVIESPVNIFGTLGDVLSVLLFIPGLALGVRRLHDTNRRGWWMFIVLIPIIGALVLLYFFVSPTLPPTQENIANKEQNESPIQHV